MKRPTAVNSDTGDGGLDVAMKVVRSILILDIFFR